MIGRGIFLGGDTVEGSIQNVENYGIINKYKALRAGAQIHIICFLNKYKVLIAGAQIYIIWFLLFLYI